MSTELVKFQFEEDCLELASYQDSIWISVRRICEILGLDQKGQQAKLRNKPWATVAIIPLVAEDRKRRDTFCIHLDSLPMWLATIEPSRVREDLREKLRTYQLKCAQILRNEFLHSPKPSSTQLMPSFPSVEPPKDPLGIMIEQMQGLVIVAKQMQAQEKRLVRVESSVQTMLARQEAATEQLLFLERAEEKPQPKSVRSKLNELVRTYCHATQCDHGAVWKKLYRELLYRYHFDACTRAKHQKGSPLDVIEQEGLLDALFQIASQILVTHSQGTETVVFSMAHEIEG